MIVISNSIRDSILCGYITVFAEIVFTAEDGVAVSA